jgi:uncharacterized RDD family membrane protein YckC
MKPRFEPDTDVVADAVPEPRLVDPEAYDASEQQFAASVETVPTLKRFVLEEPPVPSTGNPASEGGHAITPALGKAHGLENKPAEETPPASLQSDLLAAPDPDSWRREVAARMDNYRARRRPRPPHYPSLQLKFDPPESSWTAPSDAGAPVSVPASLLSVAMQEHAIAQPEAETVGRVAEAQPHFELSEAGARILEFPRSAAPPPPPLDELAEPVIDRPRILEVPEAPPPPPALGGIMMDPADEPEKERRPGFELPLLAAPLSRRLAAGGIDGLIVLSAFALFGYVFFRVTSTVPPLRPALGASALPAAIFWEVYQYLLLVYTGSTPGLKLAKLELACFDGTRVPRRMRRWRVLASVLSALSLMLGYAWCFLDEDRLCWHDRITRTYMAPRRGNSKSE